MAENRVIKLGKRMDFECHQMEHQLGAYTNCNHGEGLAVLHPVYYRHIYKYGLPKFKRFATEVMGVSAEAKTDEEIALAGIEALEDFIVEIGLPVSLQDLGVNENTDLKEIADSCALMPGSYKKMTHEEILGIFKECSLFMVLTMVLSLAACSTNQSPSESTPEESSSQTNESTPTPSNTNGKNLVVYFSMPDNVDDSTVVIDGETLGNTQYMAYVIQETVGADIFRIEPETPYPTDHDELVDLASEEQSNNARPAIKDTIENFDTYENIFVGYPNWWGDMPMILYSFFDEYDFSGKTIIPFNTHGGSGFSGTISTIKELEPNAEVLDGKSISRNDIQDAEQEIVDWVNSLDLKQAEEQPDSSAEAQQPTMGRFLYLCRFGYE